MEDLKFKNPVSVEEGRVRNLFDGCIKRLRRVDDNTDTSYVFDNQIETAKEIIYNFYTKKVRWNLLLAEMQSGKSGTFFSIPYIISKNSVLCKTLKIDMFDNEINVFLLTGMNEKELISQFEKDINGFTGMELTKNVLHNSEMRKFLSKPEADWGISDKFIIDRMRKNSLILIDESHYGSDKNQILNNFLTKILKVNPNGDQNLLEKNNIYVVSISATPMAEFINSNIAENKKKIIPLKNADGYFGIVEMFKASKIKQGYDLKDNSSVDRFLDQILNIKKDGYILVRCTAKQQLLIEKRIGERLLNLPCLKYDQWHKYKILDNVGINDILDKQINHKQIIFLKGLLRAGKRVNTKNVIMVHDTAESNVDTTVQSLLGRCCGYGKNQNIDIYCDKISAEKYKDWVESGFSLSLVPDKSKNVIKTSKNKFHLERVTILKYDLKETLRELYKKIRKTENDRKKIIIEHIGNSEYTTSKFFVGSLYDITKKSVKDAYNSKDGYLCYGDKDKEFNESSDSVIGNYVITPVIDLINNKIEFSIGEIVPQEVLTNEKTMFHETNEIK